MPPITIDELLIADDPQRWAQLGFDVRERVCQIGEVRLRFLDDARSEGQRGIAGWSLRNLHSTELDGLPTTRSSEAGEAGGAAAGNAPGGHAPAGEVGEAGGLARTERMHPNGVSAIDHIVVASPDLDRTVPVLQRAGLDLRRVREQPTPAGAPRQAFFRLGAEIVEVIQEPQEAIEQAGGPDHPARFWGLALVAPDIDRTVAALGEHSSPARPAVQPGRRIASLRRSTGIRVPLAIMSAAGAG